MQHLIEHARSFPQTAQQNEEFRRLATGQSPHALFITCSDSRVVPSLITGARPGELFELRTAGHIVPRYAADEPSGEAATIEYALNVLKVPDIIMCGHSHCGAVGARARGEDLSAMPAVAGWLDSQLPENLGELNTEQAVTVAAAVQRTIRDQLDRLYDYPGVAERTEAGQLRLHGWFYAVDTGLVLAYEPSVDAFLPL